MTIYSPSSTDADPGFIAAPEWTRDLVIYEINPYAFTSPNGAGDGSGSGTFASTREKLPYLQDLGITALWLAGYCPATTHFYNIKSVYACVRPDAFDPALGTAADFRALIDAAHTRGIRVFLDVITHGVVEGSPLPTARPGWFKGTTWGMRDYDYSNPEFRAWWVETWVNYVTDYGVDGYRLDVPRFDQMALWNLIAARCAAAGHSIVIFPEVATAYHFSQRDRAGFSNDIAGEFSPAPRYYGVQISCHDEGWVSPAGNYYRVRGNRCDIGYTLFGANIPLWMAGEEFQAEQVSLPRLERGLYGGGGPGGWLYGSWIQWDQPLREPHAAMLTDMRKILRIRRENKHLLHADRAETHILQVPSVPTGRPIPYVRFGPGREAIAIVGNASHDPGESQTFTLKLPIAAMGLAGHDQYTITDLWTGTSYIVNEADLNALPVLVPGAYEADGGIRAVKITPSPHR
jgi:hypothetical protein